MWINYPPPRSALGVLGVQIRKHGFNAGDVCRKKSCVSCVPQFVPAGAVGTNQKLVMCRTIKMCRSELCCVPHNNETPVLKVACQVFCTIDSLRGGKGERASSQAGIPSPASSPQSSSGIPLPHPGSGLKGVEPPT